MIPSQTGVFRLNGHSRLSLPVFVRPAARYVCVSGGGLVCKRSMKEEPAYTVSLIIVGAAGVSSLVRSRDLMKMGNLNVLSKCAYFFQTSQNDDAVSKHLAT